MTPGICFKVTHWESGEGECKDIVKTGYIRLTVEARQWVHKDLLCCLFLCMLYFSIIKYLLKAFETSFL